VGLIDEVAYDTVEFGAWYIRKRDRLIASHITPVSDSAAQRAT
jgi:hypothetical protein